MVFTIALGDNRVDIVAALDREDVLRESWHSLRPKHTTRTHRTSDTAGLIFPGVEFTMAPSGDTRRALAAQWIPNRVTRAGQTVIARISGLKVSSKALL